MFNLLIGYIAVPVVAVVAILAVVAAIGAFISHCYIKAPPTEAIVVTGLGYKEPKVVSGRGVVVIPFLQRYDKITMRIMKLDVKTPATGVKTSEGVPLWIDSVVTVQVYSQASTVSESEWQEAGCKNRDDFIIQRQQAAISNFLGAQEADFDQKVNDVLQGNLRENVAEMPVNDVLTKRKEFAIRVMKNAKPDLAKLGLEVVTFNIQDIQDAVDGCGAKHGVVEAIGVEREMEVLRAAEVARAKAKRDIAIAQADTEREAEEKKAENAKKIAEANNALALRQAELKAEADRAAADAAAAGQIQFQLQEKTRREAEADVEIAAQEKAILRNQKAAEVERQRLDAEVQKRADAEKYRREREAEATKYAAEQAAEADKRKQELQAEADLYVEKQKAEAIKIAAEARLEEAQKEAAGIQARGEAEAAAIRAKALAEAEGIEKKAEAQAKMGEASKLEMLYNVLPQIAEANAKILAGVDQVTLYGTDTASNLMSATTQGVSQFVRSWADGSGMPLDVNALAGAAIGAKIAEGHTSDA